MYFCTRLFNVENLIKTQTSALNSVISEQYLIDFAKIEVCVFCASASVGAFFILKKVINMGKHKTIIIEKIKEGLYTLQDLEHGLEACGETPEDCMKNLELALKAFEIYDKIKKEEEK